jgi:hypothetical protein
VKALRAGAAYFALVFAAGFVLGMLRVPFLVPRVGVRVAELLEAPVMLAVILLASRHVVRRFGLAASPYRALAAGVSALFLLIAAELLLAALLQGRPVAAYVSERDPVSGSVYLACLLLYALMPWLHARRGTGPGPDGMAVD